jgi:hypothetical protein
MTSYLKNSEALNAQFEAAHIAVADIIELQENAETVSGQIGTKADILFDEIVRIQKDTDQPVNQIFNTLAYLSGHDFYQDSDGNPDAAGKKNNRDCPWPKGTLSTYRAQCQKAERPTADGGLATRVSEFPDFKTLRADVNPRVKKTDELLELIKRYRKELSADDAQHVDVDAANYIEKYVRAILEERAANAAAKEAETKQKPLTKTQADKRTKTQAAKASVKSNAKRKAA